MTYTRAQQQLVERMFDPIAADPTSVIRRRKSSLERQGLTAFFLARATGLKLKIYHSRHHWIATRDGEVAEWIPPARK